MDVVAVIVAIGAALLALALIFAFYRQAANFLRLVDWIEKTMVVMIAMGTSYNAGYVAGVFDQYMSVDGVHKSVGLQSAIPAWVILVLLGLLVLALVLETIFKRQGR